MKTLLRKILPRSLFRKIKALWREARYQVNSLLVRTKIRLSLPLKPKRSKIRFEVHITEHCNLNCKACNNFSCIADPEFVDVEEFRRDLERMGEIFSHECEQIYLIGGEPLLNPEIITLMKIARENFTKGNISVFTNGLLLAKMPAEFWEACHDNNIGVHVSAYPVKLDIEAIKSLAQKYDASFSWSSSREDFYIEPINLKGNSNVKLNYGLCVRANSCIALSHGRLFTCTFAPNVHHFNKKFGTKIEITPADYVDIYSDVTADELLQRMSEPIPACRWCSLRNRNIRPVEWGITQGKIEEWT